MKTVKLGDVCDFRNGLWTGKKPPFREVFVLRNTNFSKKNGKLDYTNVAELEVEDSQFQKRQLKYGDIILEKSGGGPKQPVGRVALFDKVEGKYSFSNFTSAISVKDVGVLDPVYLHRYLNYMYLSGVTEHMQKHTTGIRNLNFDEYKKIDIPLPSLEEQRRVVKRLDAAFEKIDRAIELTEKNIQNSDLLFHKLVNGAIKKSDDSPKVAMGKVCSFTRGPFGGSLKKQIFKAKGYAVYEQRHAIYNRFDNVRYFIDDEKYKDMLRFALHPGNLIMSCSGTMGKIAIVPEDAKPGIINQALLKLSPDDKSLSSAYLKLWMQSDMFQHALAINSGGAAIKNVASVKILKEIEIPLPNTEIQVNIVAEIDKLEKTEKTLTDKYGVKLSELKALKQSLLTQAFSGSGVE